MEITIDNAHIEILNFRTKHGITQGELSEKAGITRATIIDMEKGRKKPHATTIFKLNKYVSLFN